MQAPNLFASLAPTSAPAQGQGAGLGISGAAGGLFGGTETIGDGSGDPLGFAEALMAAMGVVVPQLQQQQPHAAVDGDAETAPAIDSARGASTAFTSTVLAQAPVVEGEVAAGDIATTEGETADLLVATATGEADVPAAASPNLAKALDAAAELVTPNQKPTTVAKEAAVMPASASPAIKSSAPVEAAVVAAAGVAATLEADAPAPPVETATAPPPVAAQQAVASAQAAQVAPTRAAHDPAKTQSKAKTEAAASAATVAAAAQAQQQTVEAETPLDATGKEKSVEGAATAAVAADRDETPELDAADITQSAFSHASARAADDAPLAPDAPKVTSHTIAQLSAQITKSLEGGRSTRFDVQLDPMGLGKVDVRVEINKAGEITADLRFDNPVSAAELRSRSGELANALQDAGFDPSKTQLSFSSGGQNQGGGQFGQNLWSQQQDQGRQAFTGRAFIDLADTPENTAAYSAQTARTGGVDVRI